MCLQRWSCAAHLTGLFSNIFFKNKLFVELQDLVEKDIEDLDYHQNICLYLKNNFKKLL